MDRFCGRCGNKLVASNNSDYDYQCLTCDEDFYEDEIYVLTESEYLFKQIEYLQRKMNVCAYGKQELQELAELQYRLSVLESGEL